MRSLSILGLCLLLVSVVSGRAAATTITHKEAQVEIAVPDGWKSAQEDDMMSLTAPDDSIVVVFLVMPGETSDKTLEGIEKHLEKSTGKIAWDEKPKEDKVNGMDAEIWGGTAKDGKVQVEAVYVDTPSGKNLAIYWVSTPESEAKYTKDIDLIVKGLKPLATPAAASPAAPTPASPAASPAASK